MDTLSPDLRLVAQRELGETPQLRNDAVRQLRKLIAEEPALECPLDEDFLVKFLRNRKYHMNDTLERIRKYFYIRLEHPDIFENLLPSRIMFDAIFRRNKLVTVLKEPDSLGRRIVVLKFGAWNPDICSLNEFFRAGLVVCEYCLLEEAMQIVGFVVVSDLEGLNFNHFRHYTPFEIKKLVQIAQECYPIRIKGIYITNNPPIFKPIYAVIKLFLKQKLVDRIHFVGRDYKKLHDLIPRERLPEEYGGTQRQQNYDSFEKSLRNLDDFYLRIGRYGFQTK